MKHPIINISPFYYFYHLFSPSLPSLFLFLFLSLLSLCLSVSPSLPHSLQRSYMDCIQTPFASISQHSAQIDFFPDRFLQSSNTLTSVTDVAMKFFILNLQGMFCIELTAVLSLQISTCYYPTI